MTTATRKSLTLLTALLATSLLLAACGSSYGTSAPAASTAPASSATSTSATKVKTALVSSLHATVLTDAAGMTLYHLSAEGNGKFICTSSSCLALWRPVTVAAGSTPSGVASLGTVKRPDGTTQVTFDGAPLYTFAQDSKPGQAGGEGFKDVGTWMAATTGEASPGSAPAGTTSSPPASEPESSSGGGYHY